MVLQVSQQQDLENTNDTISFRVVGVFHALQTAKLSDKYEKAMKKMCWNDASLIIGLEDKYVGNQNNTATHILIVAMNVGMADMHTVYPWLGQILLHIYDSHVASQIFICLKQAIGIFTGPSVLCILN